MKIKRHIAVSTFKILGSMALGYLEDATLEATMDNFNAFRKVVDDFDRLKEELSKRIYANIDEKKVEDFFKVVGKYEDEKDEKKKAEYKKLMKDSYAEIYLLYEKHITVLTSLANKEVEVEIVKVDKDTFILGIMKGNKNNSSFFIEHVFGFMLKDAEVLENNFTELDELLRL